jgi:hypothetical protein
LILLGGEKVAHGIEEIEIAHISNIKKEKI